MQTPSTTTLTATNRFTRISEPNSDSSHSYPPREDSNADYLIHQTADVRDLELGVFTPEELNARWRGGILRVLLSPYLPMILWIVAWLFIVIVHIFARSRRV
ncbi:uncharacterized protein K460DRAFT_160193 [Cucurbitaria berberidis CBS 394.84]|uniref:Uncharacterized protein n=1 Tax=Cucurbitaria berberidis CBS 394.84 TaxID=1168544 RepID=A0A9P4GEV5_9PLEO|nr:uncharacterized protein K460DRAFT_160193 [Cucurbitaria berberidis CBS 394.84]KAF1844201.1 hypothetical protein K460DRAFT_160193 [Cucurbitaria berberidis CBS 394.84]